MSNIAGDGTTKAAFDTNPTSREGQRNASRSCLPHLKRSHYRTALIGSTVPAPASSPPHSPSGSSSCLFTTHHFTYCLLNRPNPATITLYDLPDVCRSKHPSRRGHRSCKTEATPTTNHFCCNRWSSFGDAYAASRYEDAQSAGTGTTQEGAQGGA